MGFRAMHSEEEHYVTKIDKIIFQKGTPEFEEIDHICFLAKNLYNATLYTTRQFFFETGLYIGFSDVNKLFAAVKDPDYTALPAKVAHHVQMQVDSAFKGFYGSLKSEKVSNAKVRMPGYLPKDGRMTAQYEKGAISKKGLKKQIISLSKTNLEIPTRIPGEDVQFARLGSNKQHAWIEIGYRVKCAAPVSEEPERAAAIDLGVDILAMVSSNCFEPFIINGKPLKSINAHFNKEIAKAKSELAISSSGEKYTSKKLSKLYRDRYNLITDQFHKSTTFIVNQLARNHVDTLIIGWNKGIKQDMGMGKVNNQNFAYIPYRRFIEMLSYKCEIVGIRVIEIGESHTSKCSFLEDENIRHHKKYKGRRITRGMFKTGDGRYIHADLNGSFNILKKGMQKMGAWSETVRNQCLPFCKEGKHIDAYMVKGMVVPCAKNATCSES